MYTVTIADIIIAMRVIGIRIGNGMEIGQMEETSMELAKERRAKAKAKDNLAKGKETPDAIIVGNSGTLPKIVGHLRVDIRTIIRRKEEEKDEIIQ